MLGAVQLFKNPFLRKMEQQDIRSSCPAGYFRNLCDQTGFGYGGTRLGNLCISDLYDFIICIGIFLNFQTECL